jgi:hypothetical protein
LEKGAEKDTWGKMLLLFFSQTATNNNNEKERGQGIPFHFVKWQEAEPFYTPTTV